MRAVIVVDAFDTARITIMPSARRALLRFLIARVSLFKSTADGVSIDRGS